MIGVDDKGQTLGTGPSCYKRDILFYDQMLLMHSDHAIGVWRDGMSKQKHRQFADEMEFLLDTPHFLRADNLAGVPIRGEGIKALDEAIREIQERIKETGSPWDRESSATLDEHLYLQSLLKGLMTRLAAASLTNLGAPAMSAYEVPRIARAYNLDKLVAGDVIRLAINKVKVPDELTSWEDIFALKEDKQLQERATKLRLWATKTARSETSLAIAEEHVSDLLADYERYLEAHNIKYATITLGAIVTGTAEIVEDALKLRLGSLAGKLFSMGKTKADMTLSEMKAPGRELSLVTHLNDRLA